MKKLDHLLIGIAAIAILFPQQVATPQAIAGSKQLTSKAAEPIPHDLVKAVLQRIETEYIDSTVINRKNWQTIRDRSLNRSYQSMEEAYKSIRELLKILGDPYTRFIDPIELKGMQTDTSGKNVGIGLQIAIDEITKQLTVISPIEDSPAQKAGIRAKDILLKINGQSTQGMGVNEAVTLLRGKAGTSVSVTVQRGQQVVNINAMRQVIIINPVRWNSQSAPSGKVGYIRLAQFSSSAREEVRQAIKTLEQQAVVGYILDLRGNSGGLLYSGMDITRLWLNSGLIATFIDRKGNPNREEAKRSALTQKPLVILVDGRSAAASEILAGALQANQRAKLVGVRTFGQNTVQSIKLLPGDSALAVTVSKWLTPKGVDISKRGLTPDIVVPLSETQRKILGNQPDLFGTLADPQYAKALEVLNQLIQQSNTRKS